MDWQTKVRRSKNANGKQFCYRIITSLTTDVFEAQPSPRINQWDCYMWERTMNLHNCVDSHTVMTLDWLIELYSQHPLKYIMLIKRENFCATEEPVF